MHGRGVEFLHTNLTRISRQTFTDYEVVVSDHSENNEICDLCRNWGASMPIHYVKNCIRRGSSSANINNAMHYARGRWIKILFQDDFFYSDDSLQKTADALESCNGWLATGSEHTYDGMTMIRPMTPNWNPNIHLGNNSIGSPTVITLRNTADKPMFNEELIWLMDCDYYRRMYDRWGAPKLIPDITVVNMFWDRRLSNTIHPEIKQAEHIKMREKYGI